MEWKRHLRHCWPRPGRRRCGLGAGFLDCECWGLPRRHDTMSAEELTLRELPLSGKVIYDVGANTGIFTMFFARQAGARGRVVAFEPVAANCELLRRHLRLNRIGNATLVPLALGAAVEQRAAVALAGSSGRVSMAGGEHPDLRYSAAGSMAVAPLDGVIAEWKLPPPDFIKMDVEGAEYEVLQGAALVLRARHPLLFIELHGKGPVRKAVQAERLCALLDALGYAQFHVESGTRVTPGAWVPGHGHLLCAPAAAGLP